MFLSLATLIVINFSDQQRIRARWRGHMHGIAHEAGMVVGLLDRERHPPNRRDPRQRTSSHLIRLEGNLWRYHFHNLTPSFPAHDCLHNGPCPAIVQISPTDTREVWMVHAAEDGRISILSAPLLSIKPRTFSLSLSLGISSPRSSLGPPPTIISSQKSSFFLDTLCFSSVSGRSLLPFNTHFFSLILRRFIHFLAIRAARFSVPYALFPNNFSWFLLEIIHS